MTDERYNLKHCDSCGKNCDDCQDAYKTKGGIKHTDTHGGLWVFDAKGYCIMRYAQRKCLDWLVKIAI